MCTFFAVARADDPNNIFLSDTANRLVNASNMLSNFIEHDFQKMVNKTLYDTIKKTSTKVNPHPSRFLRACGVANSPIEAVISAVIMWASGTVSAVYFVALLRKSPRTGNKYTATISLLKEQINRIITHNRVKYGKLIHENNVVYNRIEVQHTAPYYALQGNVESNAWYYTTPCMLASSIVGVVYQTLLNYVICSDIRGDEGWVWYARAASWFSVFLIIATFYIFIFTAVDFVAKFSRFRAWEKMEEGSVCSIQIGTDGQHIYNKVVSIHTKMGSNNYPENQEAQRDLEEAKHFFETALKNHKKGGDLFYRAMTQLLLMIVLLIWLLNSPGILENIFDAVYGIIIVVAISAADCYVRALMSIYSGWEYYVSALWGIECLNKNYASGSKQPFQKECSVTFSEAWKSMVLKNHNTAYMADPIIQFFP